MRKTRTGFTLVELLVVMALIALVATMAVMFFPSVATSQREANAAQQLQGWLNIAKQRALRNQRPGGLRLWVTSVTINANTFPNVVTECQYIEQPDEFRTGTLSTVPLTTPSVPPKPPNPGTPMMPFYKTVLDVVQISGVDVTNGYSPLMPYDYINAKAGFPTLPKAAPSPPGLKTFVAGNNTYGYDPNQIYWAVQPCPFIKTVPFHNYYPYVPNPQGVGGDYLEVYGSGMMHQIIAVLGVDPNFSYLQVWPPLPTAIAATTNFRIVRGPRVVGTEMLTLPENTFIDLITNVLYNNPLPNLSASTVSAATVAANNVAEELEIDGAVSANAGTASIDILFSPSGQVISPGVATSNLHLWVRSPSEDAAKAFTAVVLPSNGHEFLGSPTIVSVFVRTGFVGAYAPNPNTADPYSLVK